jgi:hypothetical protein
VVVNEIYTLLNCKDSEHVPMAPLLSLGLCLEVKIYYNNLFKTKKFALHEVTMVI